jgi:putative tricarboxylic transport membrane protein
VDYFTGILTGFSVLFEPINLFMCFIGVLTGTIIGILPGIGPIGAMAILLPSTFDLPPVTGIIMLAGIYYGAMYGGSTTSILVNIPGEAASVVTCLDGYQMARQGRAGPALGICAIGSFIGGSIGIIILMFLVYPLAEIAIKFGPPEYFSIMVMGLVLVMYLARGSLIKAGIMVVVGLVLGCVGVDTITGSQRFTIGIPALYDGVPLIPMIMGLFGIAEILTNLEKLEERTIFETKISNIFPTLLEWKKSIWAIIRGTFLGFGLGVIPGGGAILASFAAYTVEKKISRNPEKFGKGAIEGVAGPETANNSATAGAFVPLLSFGIPSNIVMAILLGALLIHGVTPGPLLVEQHPEIFWGLIASMYLGNVMLLILNLPLIPIWVKILKVPYRILFPIVLLMCLVGVYSINNSKVDIFLMVFFGVVGYVLRKKGYEFAPLVLAFVLGPLMEDSFRQTLIISKGSFTIFYERTVTLACLIIAASILVTSGLSFFKKTRQKIDEGTED